MHPFWTIIALVLISCSMALLIFESWQVAVESRNAYLLLVEFPFAIGMGALSGLLLRRPGAGGWVFAAVVLGAFVGDLAYAYFVESRQVPMGPYQWNSAALTGLLGSILLGTPAGAAGFWTGLVRPEPVPSNALAVSAIVLGIPPTLFGIAMLPVAVFEWARGYALTLVLTSIGLASGWALFLGAVRIWQLRAREQGTSEVTSMM